MPTAVLASIATSIMDITTPTSKSQFASVEQVKYFSIIKEYFNDTFISPRISRRTL